MTEIRDKKREKMPPMLMKKCLYGESEYCEDENDHCYSDETFDTFNCHICNVDVPVLCFKTHNVSEKHVTLKTIFQKALERVSKQMNKSIINNDKDIDKNVYYCEPCCKMIKIENKLKHESSEYHVKSQNDIIVVKEFYKIFEGNQGYVGGKEVKTEEILYEKKNLGTEMSQNDAKNNNVRGVTDEDISNGDEAKTVSATNDHTMKPTCTVENLVANEEHNEELATEDNYFKEMVKKYNLEVNLPIIDGEFIHVASPSGVKVKIPQDHFHSYRSVVEEIRIYCQMCIEHVELGEESEHKVSEKHAKNVLLPVNENFARTINDYSHCLICNKVVVASRLSQHYNNNHVKLDSTKITDICQNNEDLANGIKTENIERTDSEHHVNKPEEKKINTCINDKEYDSGDHLNESGRTKDAASDKKIVFCKLCNVRVPQDQIEYHNAGTPHWSNALKNIWTGVTEGFQAFFSKDNLKTVSDLSEKPNDTVSDIPNNENVTKQNEIPKNDNVAKQNDITKNDNVTKQNDIPKNDNVTEQNDIPKNDNVTKQNDIPKNDNVTEQNDIPKNDNETKQNDIPKNHIVTKQNDIPKNDNVTEQNDIPKNDNVTEQNDIPKNDNETKQNDIPKNHIVTKQNDIPKNDNVTKQNDIPKNDNVTEQNDIPKNDNVTEQNDIPKNDNETKQNDIPKNDNETKQNDIPKNHIVTKQNDIPKNDNVTKQNDIPKNDNVTEQNDIPKNDNVTEQNDIPKNDNETKQNDIPKNDNVTKQNDIPKNDDETKQNYVAKNYNIASTSLSNTAYFINNDIDSSTPFRYADHTKNKVTCKVCDIDIANVLQSIKNHEASSSHKLWLRKLLEFHTIKENSNLSSCECCITSTISNIWAHIGTERHTALLQLEYEIDSKTLKLYVHTSKVRNNNGIMSRELYKMMLDSNKIYKLPNSNFFCSFCEIELCDKGNEIDHMFSVAHEEWLKKVFKSC